MKDIGNIDIHAMQIPRDNADVLMMLREIRMELQNINTHIDAAAEACEKSLEQA